MKEIPRPEILSVTCGIPSIEGGEVLLHQIRIDVLINMVLT